MARSADALRDEVIAAIRRLTVEPGVKEGVRLAREQYPDIPDGT
ncbi:hypothetical protein [Microvirga sp. BSC39]|nr:hypothetical protein [Microvirga sp. BSC39]